MRAPAATVLRDQCEMEGSERKRQKNATGKRVPEGSGGLEGRTELRNSRQSERGEVGGRGNVGGREGWGGAPRTQRRDSRKKRGNGE